MIKKRKDIAKWEGKIGKSHTLSKLFTKVIKSQWGGDPTPLSPLVNATVCIDTE